jgi:hypothetical protein
MQPNQDLKVLWDVYYSLLILVRIIIVSIKISFFSFDMVSAIDFVGDWLSVLINLSFAVDVVLSLLTGYYNEGQIVLERRKIAVNYL